MADVVNGSESQLNGPDAGAAGEAERAVGPLTHQLGRRAVLLVLLLWTVQFAAFSLDRLLRVPDVEGWDTVAARLVVTGTGVLLSLLILGALHRVSGRSFLARSAIAFVLALVAATVHALVNVFVFRFMLGPYSAEPLPQELALVLPPLVFFFSWVHLAIAVVLLSLTYGEEVVLKERRLGEIAGQLENLKRLRPDEQDEPHLWVRKGAQRIRLNVGDIDWIAAEGEYVRLHLGERSVLERRSLTDMERQLEPLGFVRVHRSAIVNSQRVESLGRKPSGTLQLRLATGQDLPVGKSYRAQVRKLVGEGGQEV